MTTRAKSETTRLVSFGIKLVKPLTGGFLDTCPQHGGQRFAVLAQLFVLHQKRIQNPPFALLARTASFIERRCWCERVESQHAFITAFRFKCQIGQAACEAIMGTLVWVDVELANILMGDDLI